MMQHRPQQQQQLLLVLLRVLRGAREKQIRTAMRLHPPSGATHSPVRLLLLLLRMRRPVGGAVGAQTALQHLLLPLWGPPCRAGERGRSEQQQQQIEGRRGLSAAAAETAAATCSGGEALERRQARGRG